MKYTLIIAAMLLCNIGFSQSKTIEGPGKPDLDPWRITGY